MNESFSFSKRKSLDFKLKLLDSDSYRNFIEQFIEEDINLGVRKISFSELSRKCDFKSRSFIRDVVARKRRTLGLAVARSD